ncbi:unnamed protein product [Dovyalis caffra]|uniref:Bifunctional inhibitor/plant lipid transfer protein/seed storage helical domain-containing protein n=1 Tax=Dovyalis caffra TaxID=77055 RepID=A0AAV1RUU6_9ROSI|nr:unnamed protein product [Dovyalis caffra]
MATLNLHFMILATFAVTGILISSNNVALGQECHGDLQGLITQCLNYVQRLGPQTDPSPQCCNAIKTVDVPCVCKYITKDIEAILDMAKVAHVTESCGLPLPHGTKCGTTPIPQCSHSETHRTREVQNQEMMAILNVNFTMVLAVFAMTGILISGDNVVHGQGCQGDLQGLITQCARYVQKVGQQMDPSQECCSAIKSVDIPCACKYITGEIEAVIDMGKVAHLADFCGKPLAHGMKCGSK